MVYLSYGAVVAVEFDVSACGAGSISSCYVWDE